MVEVTGLAPLAARPGEQRTALFSLRPCLPSTRFSRKPFAPANASTLKSRHIPRTKNPQRTISADFLVEVTGLEPTTSWSLTKRATKLRYTSMSCFENSISYYNNYSKSVKRFFDISTKNFPRSEKKRSGAFFCSFRKIRRPSLHDRYCRAQTRKSTISPTKIPMRVRVLEKFAPAAYNL